MVSTIVRSPRAFVRYCRTTYSPGGALGNLVWKEALNSVRAPRGSKGLRAVRTAVVHAGRATAPRKALAALSQLSPSWPRSTKTEPGACCHLGGRNGGAGGITGLGVKPAARGADPSKEHRKEPLHAYLPRQDPSDGNERHTKPRWLSYRHIDEDNPPEARDRDLQAIATGRQRFRSGLVIGMP